MSDGNQPKQPVKLNYAAAAGGGNSRPAAAPVAKHAGPPPGSTFLGGNGAGAAAPSGGPPPRTSSAPPEQQGMQQHLKNSPAFIPDKSAGGRPGGPLQMRAAPYVPSSQQSGGPRPMFNPSYNFVPRNPPGSMPPQYGVPPPYGAVTFTPSGGAQYGGSPVALSPPTSNTPATAPVASPPKKKSAAIQIKNPETGEAVVLGLKKPPVKVASTSFEPKKEGDDKKAKEGEKPKEEEKGTTGEVTRPGRWKPPVDEEEEAEKKKKEAEAARQKKAEEEKAAEAKAADEAAEKKKKEEEEQQQQKAAAEKKEKEEAAPTAASAKVSASEALQSSSTDEADVAFTMPPGMMLAEEREKEEWEKGSSKVAEEVQERAAAAAKEIAQEEPAEPVKLEPIRYDGVSYNPIEDEGSEKKKRYTKEFLMQFQPHFKEKPQSLEELDIVNSGSTMGGGGNRGHNHSPNQRGGRNRNSAQARAAEQWERSREGGGGSHRDNYGGGGRRGYGGYGGNKKRQQKYTGPPVEPLVRSANGWKPEKVDTSTEDGMRLALIKEAQGHLNKMTQVTYDKLSQSLCVIASKSVPGLLRDLINKVFEQALLQPTFCSMYAALCTKMSRTTQNFRRELLNKCQEEFEADTVEPPAELPEPEREMLRFKAKKRMLGNIKFICELYKQKMLVEQIMHACIQRLFKMDLQNPDEEQTEALCDFLVRIGKMLDSKDAKEQGAVDSYFQKLDVMRKGPNIGARLRFMVEDVVDLRNNGWRQAKAGAKSTRGKHDKVKIAQNPSRNGNKPSPAKDDWQVQKSSKSKPSKRDKDKKGKDSRREDKLRGGSRSDRGSRGSFGPSKDRGSGSSPSKRKDDDRTPSPSKDSHKERAPAAAAAAPSSNAAAAAAGAAAAVTDEDNERYVPAVRSAIDELWETQEVEDVVYAIEKDFPERYRQHFILEAFKHSLTASEKDRAFFIDSLFAPELTEGIFVKSVLRGGVSLIVDQLADIAMDHPAAPGKFAPLLVRAVNEELFSFKEMLSLCDEHIEEGRKYGVCGETLGTVLKSMCEALSVDHMKELLATHHFTNILAKLPERARTSEMYGKFLADFGLEGLFPAFSEVGAAASAERKGSGPPPVVHGSVVYSRADQALKDDTLALKVFETLEKEVANLVVKDKDTQASALQRVKKVILDHVKPEGDELYGDFAAAKSVFRAVLEHWLVYLPVAGSVKVLDGDTIKLEANYARFVARDLLMLFAGSDKSEMGDTVVEAFSNFSEYHGREINAAFYIRLFQYWTAYKFLTPGKLEEISRTKSNMSSVCLRILQIQKNAK